jgi:hypothetical protein
MPLRAAPGAKLGAAACAAENQAQRATGATDAPCGGTCQVVAQVGPPCTQASPSAATTGEWSWPNHPACPRERTRAVNHGSCRSALTSQFGVGAGPSLALDSAFQARDPGATSHRKITDNSGHWRLTDPTAQPSLSVIIAGRPSTRVLSRTEEVAWASIRAGSVPQRARAGIGGHQRSHGLTQQAAHLPAHATWMLQAANQLAVPEVIDIPGGPLLRTVGKRGPTYFYGIPLQTGPSHPRRTRQTCSIAPTNQTKNPPGHPSLRGAADRSRLQPL